jgi:FtsZ-binding cell division protein ZapB
VAIIGQPSPDDVYELLADVLERNAELRKENRQLRKGKDYWRGRVTAELRKAKA